MFLIFFLNKWQIIENTKIFLNVNSFFKKKQNASKLYFTSKTLFQSNKWQLINSVLWSVEVVCFRRVLTFEDWFWTTTINAF
jgi:hypothetical protein